MQMGTLMIFSDQQRDNKTIQIQNVVISTRLRSVPNSTSDSAMTETKIHNERAPSAGHTWEGSNDKAYKGNSTSMPNKR